MKQIFTLVVALCMFAVPVFGQTPDRFDDAAYFMKTGEKKSKQVEGDLVFDQQAKTIKFERKKKAELAVPYDSVTGLLYEKTASPRYISAILISPFFIFSKSKKHYLTVQYKDATGQGQVALFRLDKKNYQLAVATAEAQTGKKVERVQEK